MHSGAGGYGVRKIPTGSKRFVYQLSLNSGMPIIDRRQLLFELQAIEACLGGVRVVSARLELPHTGLKAIRLDEAKGHVELSFTAETRCVDSSQMAGLLIAFCRMLSLPTPKDARKELSQLGQCLALVFISEVPLRMMGRASGEQAHGAVEW